MHNKLNRFTNDCIFFSFLEPLNHDDNIKTINAIFELCQWLVKEKKFRKTLTLNIDFIGRNQD